MSDPPARRLPGLHLPGLPEAGRLRGRALDPGGRGRARRPHAAGRGAGRRRPPRRRLLLRGGGRQEGPLRPHRLQLGRLRRMVKSHRDGSTSTWLYGNAFRNVITAAHVFSFFHIRVTLLNDVRDRIHILL